MTRVDEIPMAVRETGTGSYGFLPAQPVTLRPGDRTERVTRNGAPLLLVYRAGFMRRNWLRLRGQL